MKRVVIIGARQHAKVVYNIIRSSKRTRKVAKVIGFVDDNPDLKDTYLLGLPILGQFNDLPRLRLELNIDTVIMGISNRWMEVRMKYFEQLMKLGFKSLNAIHDTAYIDRTAKIGVGLVINPNCVINAFTKVGNNVVAYSGVTIEHEDLIGDNVYLGPGVNLSSGVHIGDNTFLGAGTKVIPDVVIGKNVTIGAGAVVIDDVPDNAVAVGVPVKKIKFK